VHFDQFGGSGDGPREPDGRDGKAKGALSVDQFDEATEAAVLAFWQRDDAEGVAGSGRADDGARATTDMVSESVPEAADSAPSGASRASVSDAPLKTDQASMSFPRKPATCSQRSIGERGMGCRGTKDTPPVRMGLIDSCGYTIWPMSMTRHE
jgi:hypothetical protein